MAGVSDQQGGDVAESIVIVGAGLAGMRTAEELRRSGFEGKIVLVGAEDHPPYDRPPLSKDVLRGERDDTALKPADFYAEQRIELALGVPAIGVDPTAQTVKLADGSTLDYDELVIATGLTPRRIPDLPDLAGVHVLRTLDDAWAVRADAATARRALVVGAGFIGCEVAASLRERGLEVVLVEPQPAPLASVLGARIGMLVGRLQQAEGVDLRCGVGLAALSGAGRVAAAELTDGSALDVDLVVIGIGSVPLTDWLADSGIELVPADTGGGVRADAVGRTGTEHVWTVGDVAAWTRDDRTRRVEHWSNAGDQAKVLARALIGAELPAAKAVPYFWSDQYDIKLQALGTPRPDDDVQVVTDDGRRFLAYYAKDGKLTGVVGAGLPAKVMKLRTQVAAGTPVDELPTGP
ncbi:NAD(P)/FAD-dependent oxidoreductase [Skermania piniformis]|uniref:FAD-dependent oxidoreductase n=1 Tax=Skermania pinensis TaxID=39122 RepID=A0ABX8S9H2_9ACTN|nr:FAD-dependent oxidoreductase [Skermania piniformis]QXQ14513.1 FAD-dependent oxidoreductase [Skermania piniformis]